MIICIAKCPHQSSGNLGHCRHTSQRSFDERLSSDTPCVMGNEPIWDEISDKTLALVSDEVLRILVELFDSPCNYGDTDKFMLEQNKDWCKKVCGKVADAECWRKFFELRAGQLANEQQDSCKDCNRAEWQELYGELVYGCDMSGCIMDDDTF